MKLSKVYKVSGDVTVILFTNNDNNHVIKCKVGEHILVDPYEYKMAYVIDNEFGNVVELNEYFNEENIDGVVGSGGGKMDLDVAGALFKNLLSKPKGEPKDVKCDSNENVSMDIKRKV